MPYRFEDIYGDVPDPDRFNQLYDDIISYRDHDLLTATDHIYSSSEYFQTLYTMTPSDMFNYANRLQMDFRFDQPENPSAHTRFNMIRTIIYYIDRNVQQALVTLNIADVTCRATDEAGHPIDPIFFNVINPYRLVYIPEDDDNTYGKCYDIVSISEWLERDSAYTDEYGFTYPVREFTNPSTNEPISADRVNQILGNEKVWWVAYLEDFDQNIPFIPDPHQPHKYKRKYQTRVAREDNIIIGNLRVGHYLGDMLNRLDFDEILSTVQDINERYYHNMTLLHMVIKYDEQDDIRKIRRLLQEGARIELKDINGNTPLLLAVEYQKWNSLEFLLEKGAPPSVINMANHNQETPLIQAGYQMKWDMVRLLVEHGALINEPGSPRGGPGEGGPGEGGGPPGTTVLMVAVKYGPVDIVQYLLQKGALPNTSDRNGNTALLYAFDSHYSIEKMRVLLDYQADPDIQNHANEDGWTLAVRKSRPDVIRLWLESDDAHPPVDNEYYNGDSLIMMVMKSHHQSFEIFDQLMNTHVDLDKVNHHGDTAIITAIEYVNDKNTRYTMIEKLLSKGANPNLQNRMGGTALILAVDKQHESLVELLLANESHPNIRNKYGDSALVLATIFKSYNIVMGLLRANSQPDIQNDRGDTPLMISASHPTHDIFEALLEHHAHPDVQNNNGETALFIALRKYIKTEQDIYLVKIRQLLEHHAHTDIQNKKRETVLDIAAPNQHVYDLLLKYTNV